MNVVELKEDYFIKLERDAHKQISKIQSILIEYLCEYRGRGYHKNEDRTLTLHNNIYLYKSKKCFLRFRTSKEYVGKIDYDSKTPFELNLEGNMDLIKPMAEKLEKHGFKVTIYY